MFFECSYFGSPLGIVVMSTQPKGLKARQYSCDMDIVGISEWHFIDENAELATNRSNGDNQGEGLSGDDLWETQVLGGFVR